MKLYLLLPPLKLKGAEFRIYHTIGYNPNAGRIVRDANGKISEVWQNGDRILSGALEIREERPTEPNFFDSFENEYLPYFARVTEELSPKLKAAKIRPEVYERCQLKNSLPMGNICFKDLKSGKWLYMKPDSEYYEPIK